MAAYLVALLLVGGSTIAGLAICSVRADATAAAPAVGLAALTVVATLGVRLPGRAVTSAVLVALPLGAAVVWLWRSRRLRSSGSPPLAAVLPALLTAGLAAAVGALPFLSTGAIGIPGVSLNNDTAVHLLWAEGLRSVEMSRLYPANPGYPLGPHSLLATLATGTGVGMDAALTGLVIAIPVLFALTAYTVLRRGAPVVLAVLASVAVAFTYLQAAWYGQAAFKEPLMALMLLGFVVGLQALFDSAQPTRARAAVPLGVLTGASLLIYSYVALVWLGLAGVLFLLFSLVAHRGPRRAATIAAVRAGAMAAAVGGAVALLCVAVELQRLWRYASAIGASPASGIPEADLGNLPQPLETDEALGIWPIADWRFPPVPDTFLFQELQLVALVAAVGGALYLIWRRREPALPAALAAAALIMALSSRGQSPYVTGKALAILAPFVTLAIARALTARPISRSERVTTLYGASVAVAVVLFVAGGASAAKVLRWTPVETPAQRDQLEALRPVLGDGPALVLVADDYAGWRLRGVPVAYVGSFPSPIALPTRPAKPFVSGQALDWDNVTSETLNRFRYVVTTAGAYTSEPPPNFRLVRRTQLLAAWQRTGPTPPREVLEPGGEPAGVLDCRTKPGRRLSRRAGVASVRLTPPVRVSGALPPLGPGSATPVEVSLSRGTWDLSIQYTSQVPLRLQLGTRTTELPANTTRGGAWWPAVRLRSSGGSQSMLVIPERASRATPNTIAASVSSIVAVRAEEATRVPLRQACGRPVDWYRLSAG